MAANALRHSYLLRMWREQGSTENRWRLSLQDVHSGEQHGFLCLDELCAYLGYRMTIQRQREIPKKSDPSDHAT